MLSIEAKRLGKSSRRLHRGASAWLLALGVVVLALWYPLSAQGVGGVDPGVRGDSAGAGAAITQAQLLR